MVKETQLTGTDYNYILGREFVIFSNGVTMSREEFKLFHSKGILVKKIMSLARVPKRLSDYQVALETGVLTPVYMPVKMMQLNQEKPKVKKAKKSKEIIVPEANITVVEQKEKQEEKKRFIPANKSQVIFFCMLFVAIGSACMSIYHSAAFLINGGKPFIIASITAVLLVLFASTGFTAARYFSEQKGLAKVFSLPFIAITSVIICYIAFSTTSVSYEQFRDEETIKTAGVQKEIGNLELHTEVQKSITETEKYLRNLEKMKTEDMTKYAFARHQKMLASEREKLKSSISKFIFDNKSLINEMMLFDDKFVSKKIPLLSTCLALRSFLSSLLIYVLSAFGME